MTPTSKKRVFRPKNQQWRSTGAFSLVELLVIIGIIGTLVSLLLPAVQTSREAARRATCQNKLKQISLAALEFQASRGELPPGLLAPVPARSVMNIIRITELDHQMIGTLPFLLPFLEETGIADQIAPDMLNVTAEPSFQIWVQNLDTWNAASNSVSAFHCPSAIRELPEKGILVFNNPYYDTSEYSALLQGAPLILKFSAELGVTDYLGNAGYFAVIEDREFDELRGPFFNRSQTRPAHITDGLSRTLLFGEISGAVIDNRRIHAHSWMGSGPMPMAFGIGNLEKWNNFSSHHPGVVGFSTIDGAVHYLNVDASQTVLEALSAMSNGDTENLDSL